MEERIIDKENSRKIKVRKVAEGDDVTDDLAPEGEEEEQEVILDIDGEEYDEDLVGLTPSKLQEELERRKRAEERAKETHEKLVAQADALFAAEKYREAAPYYRQATFYDDERAERAYWDCMTERGTTFENLLGEAVTDELAAAPDGIRTAVFVQLGAKIRAEKKALEEKVPPLKERVEAGMGTRREAFGANRKYYLLRFGIAFLLMIVLATACAVSSSYIVRTRGAGPLIATAVLGGLALVAMGVMFFFARGLYLANRLCRENERYSSTEDGAVLEEYLDRIEALSSLLAAEAGLPGEEPEEETEGEPEEPEETEETGTEGEPDALPPEDEE